MEPRNFKSFVFREVIKTNSNLIFDEWAFMNILHTISGIKIMNFYEETLEKYCDVLPPQNQEDIQMRRRFHKEPFYLEVNGGRVLLHGFLNHIWYTKEYAMCHLQKRKITINTDTTNPFIIHQKSFLPLDQRGQIKKQLEELSEIEQAFAVKYTANKKRMLQKFSCIKNSPYSVGLRLIRFMKDNLLTS